MRDYSIKDGLNLAATLRRDDRGHTLIEMLVVMIMTSLLAVMFGQILVSSIQIYSNHNQRKTGNIDARRACDMLMNEVRDWRSWDGAPTATKVKFKRIAKLLSGVYYYDEFRVTFEFSGGQLTYARENDGKSTNKYILLQDGAGSSQFSTVTLGTTKRVTIQLVMTVNGRPMQLRTTVFPRLQGG